MVQSAVDSVNGEVSGIVIGNIMFELGFKFASGRVEYNVYKLINSVKRGTRLAWAGMLRANPLKENVGVNQTVKHGKTGNNIEGWEDSFTDTAYMRETLGEAAKFLTNVS